jgi:putative ABC transport system ATP-binding protein
VLLKLEHIGKTYYTDDVETRALQDITFAIERGEYVSVEGPSGCGKSTLLSIIGLLDSPTAGTYELNGKAVERLSSSERSSIRNHEIGFIFQNFNLIGDLTVQENVELPLVYRGVSKRERKRRVADVLDRVGITHRAGHYPAQLSGGQQQRVAVARALGGNPSLLLADEPTGNLDTVNGQAVMQLLSELHADGATIVMVTHDRAFANCAQRKIGLLDGCLRESADLVEAHQ